MGFVPPPPPPSDETRYVPPPPPPPAAERSETPRRDSLPSRDPRIPIRPVAIAAIALLSILGGALYWKSRGDVFRPEQAQATLQNTLPAYLETKAFVPSKTAPDRYQFTATVSPREDLYIPGKGGPPSLLLLAIANRSGDKLTLYGRFGAVRTPQGWRVAGLEIDSGLTGIGKPIGSFPPQTPLVGTPEAAAKLDEFNRAASQEKAAPAPSETPTPPTPAAPTKTVSPPSDSTPQTASSIEPPYHPGKSRLLTIKEAIQGAPDGLHHPPDTWIYGKMTVYKFQGTSGSIICQPAGQATSLTLESLVGANVWAHPVVIQAGWYFDNDRLPSLHQNQVISISSQHPAKLFSTERLDAGTGLTIMLTAPPAVVK